MLRLLKGQGGGRGGGDNPITPVEVLVKNTSGSPLSSRFGILKVASPRITYSAANAQTFFDEDTLLGTTPAVAAPFVVVQEPLSADGFGIARLLGLTRVQIEVSDAAHEYADCTTLTTKLTSGTTGPARILWKEAGTGTKWAVVNLLGATPRPAYGWARFTLPSALATTDASKASCTVDDYWGGSSPGATITVYNLPASSNYIFSGASGNKGLATYDDLDNKWWIVQLQCP